MLKHRLKERRNIETLDLVEYPQFRSETVHPLNLGASHFINAVSSDGIFLSTLSNDLCTTLHIIHTATRKEIIVIDDLGAIITPNDCNTFCFIHNDTKIAICTQKFILIVCFKSKKVDCHYFPENIHHIASCLFPPKSNTGEAFVYINLTNHESFFGKLNDTNNSVITTYPIECSIKFGKESKISSLSDSMEFTSCNTFTLPISDATCIHEAIMHGSFTHHSPNDQFNKNDSTIEWLKLPGVHAPKVQCGRLLRLEQTGVNGSNDEVSAPSFLVTEHKHNFSEIEEESCSNNNTTHSNECTENREESHFKPYKRTSKDSQPAPDHLAALIVVHSFQVSSFGSLFHEQNVANDSRTDGDENYDFKAEKSNENSQTDEEETKINNLSSLTLDELLSKRNHIELQIEIIQKQIKALQQSFEDKRRPSKRASNPPPPPSPVILPNIPTSLSRRKVNAVKSAHAAANSMEEGPPSSSTATTTKRERLFHSQEPGLTDNSSSDALESESLALLERKLEHFMSKKEFLLHHIRIKDVSRPLCLTFIKIVSLHMKDCVLLETAFLETAGRIKKVEFRPILYSSPGLNGVGAILGELLVVFEERVSVFSIYRPRLGTDAETVRELKPLLSDTACIYLPDEHTAVDGVCGHAHWKNAASPGVRTEIEKRRGGALVPCLTAERERQTAAPSKKIRPLSDMDHALIMQTQETASIRMLLGECFLFLGNNNLEIEENSTTLEENQIVSAFAKRQTAAITGSASPINWNGIGDIIEPLQVEDLVNLMAGISNDGQVAIDPEFVDESSRLHAESWLVDEVTSKNNSDAIEVELGRLIAERVGWSVIASTLRSRLDSNLSAIDARKLIERLARKVGLNGLRSMRDAVEAAVSASRSNVYLPDEPVTACLPLDSIAKGRKVKKQKFSCMTDRDRAAILKARDSQASRILRRINLTSLNCLASTSGLKLLPSDFSRSQSRLLSPFLTSSVRKELFPFLTAPPSNIEGENTTTTTNALPDNPPSLILLRTFTLTPSLLGQQVDDAVFIDPISPSQSSIAILSRPSAPYHRSRSSNSQTALSYRKLSSFLFNIRTFRFPPFRTLQDSACCTSSVFIRPPVPESSYITNIPLSTISSQIKPFLFRNISEHAPHKVDGLFDYNDTTNSSSNVSSYSNNFIVASIPKLSYSHHIRGLLFLPPVNISSRARQILLDGNHATGEKIDLEEVVDEDDGAIHMVVLCPNYDDWGAFLPFGFKQYKNNQWELKVNNERCFERLNMTTLPLPIALSTKALGNGQKQIFDILNYTDERSVVEDPTIIKWSSQFTLPHATSRDEHTLKVPPSKIIKNSQENCQIEIFENLSEEIFEGPAFNSAPVGRKNLAVEERQLKIRLQLAKQVLSQSS